MDVLTGGMCVHISMTHMHEAPDSRMHRQPQLSFSAIELCRAYHISRSTTPIMSCAVNNPVWKLCSPVAPWVPQPNWIAVVQSLFPQCLHPFVPFFGSLSGLFLGSVHINRMWPTGSLWLFHWCKQIHEALIMLTFWDPDAARKHCWNYSAKWYPCMSVLQHDFCNTYFSTNTDSY